MVGYKTGLACLMALISPVIAAVAGWVWGIFQRTPPVSDAGVCAGCGYDLNGNVSGVCPECGLAIAVEEVRTVEIGHVRPAAPQQDQSCAARDQAKTTKDVDNSRLST